MTLCPSHAPPGTAGDTADQNRLKPCRERSSDLYGSWNRRIKTEIPGSRVRVGQRSGRRDGALRGQIMKQRILIALAAGAIALTVAFVMGASSNGASEPAAAKPAEATMPLYNGLGSVHHPVSTTSPLAQKYFDQGLAFTYGFNHDAAERSFEEAARIDPKLAMASWGVALVLGPNYNLPGDPARSKKAYEAVARADA